MKVHKLLRRRSSGSLGATAVAAVCVASLLIGPSEAADVERVSSEPHWAYTTPVKPAAPTVRNADRVRNEIDRFIVKRLEDEGLQPAEEASPRVLIRRLYFDLIGLPPSPAEVKAFVQDPSQKAYESLVNRLLADPRYGEKWGRHWLDLARYADTNSYIGDTERYHVWRYRDYVIDAFNSDKPYDRFVTEQLAGDEIIQNDMAVVQPAPKAEMLVAMTFLRLAPWNSSMASFARDNLLSEITSTVGEVFLGTTLGCAKCHDHKYDPIPQRDFYRIKAFFAPMELAKKRAEFFPQSTQEEMSRIREEHRSQLDPARAELTAMRKEFLKRLAEFWNENEDERPTGKAEPGILDLLRVIFNEDDNQNADFDKSHRLFTAEEKATHRELMVRVKLLGKKMERVQPYAFSVENSKGPPFGPDVPATFVLTRGEYNQFGERVEPGFLSCVTGNSKPAQLVTNRFASRPSVGRRMTLAKWIVRPDNSLTARVMVNRIWQQHFGRGIVDTPSNFGRNGSPPSHPKLLDWLSIRFVEEKWSVKKLHRLILASATFRQASQRVDAEAERVDPENRLLSRFPERRLQGEQIRDSVLAVSGRLSPKRGGPPIFPPLPENLGEMHKILGVNVWETSEGPDARRRSVYIFQRHSLNFPFLEVLDAPVPAASCAGRRTNTTPLQALTMYNGEFVNEEAKHFAARVQRDSGPDLEKQIECAFELAYSREPKEAELKQAIEFLGSVADDTDALAGFCRVLFNSNEFVYID